MPDLNRPTDRAAGADLEQTWPDDVDCIDSGVVVVTMRQNDDRRLTAFVFTTLLSVTAFTAEHKTRSIGRYCS
jgi:hypothetical protein